VTNSAQKSPKGAAGQAQQVHDMKSLLKDNSMQKSPKGAARQAQQVHDTKSLLKDNSVQKSPKGAAGQSQRTNYPSHSTTSHWQAKGNRPYYTINSQITYTQRGATNPAAQINTIAFSPPSLLRTGGGQRFHSLPQDKSEGTKHTTSAQPSG
jgi:hypothetical protein